MPASDEFVALCHAQVTLLTQGLGAALGVIYLAEDLAEGVHSNVLPVVAYPEFLVDWHADEVLSLLTRNPRRESTLPRLVSQPDEATDSLTPNLSPSPHLADLPLVNDVSSDAADSFYSDPDLSLNLQRQAVSPLVYEGVVMGFLVTARADRLWTEQEQLQIQHIAQTLAIARMLDQRTEWLKRDLHHQKRLWREQRDRLDDLLHQFRNPLTALRTFGKLLLKRLLPEDANHGVAESVVRESDRLQALLKQFDRTLELGREEPLTLPADQEWAIAAMKSSARPSLALPAPQDTLNLSLPFQENVLTGTSLNIQPCTLTTLFKPLLLNAEAIASDRQLQLHVSVEGNLPPVLVDAALLQEVLSNLIDNALKYTPSGGHVLVQIEAADSASHPTMQLVAIADTGPGIPPADLPHIFERHYRGVQADTEIPGTGLGLAIAQTLVQAMQGVIEVFSPAQAWSHLAAEYEELAIADHPGTVVVLWLPVAA
jgi:signal transduction histidine kinase